MLWIIAVDLWSGICNLFEYALMITGGATCIWVPLSRYRLMGSKKALGGIAGGLLVLTVGLKMFSGSQPAAATAAVPPGTPAASASAPPQISAAVPAPVTSEHGSVWPQPRSSPGTEIKPAAPARSAPRVAPKTPAGRDALAERFADKANGYSIQLPSGWATRQLASGEPWFLVATDGKGAVISVGFSPFASSAGIEQLKPTMTARYQAQPATHLSGQGTGPIDGHKAIWFRYTGPIDTAAGHQVMECVHYYVPLHDGRMMELRLSAAPDRFATAAPMLRKSLATIKLLTN